MNLLHIFDSKQFMYDNIGIHHVTLNKCLSDGSLWLDTFFFSLEDITEGSYDNIFTLEEVKDLVSNCRKSYKVLHPRTKFVLASPGCARRSPRGIWSRAQSARPQRLKTSNIRN